MPNLPLLHLTWNVLIADLGRLWSSMVCAWALAIRPRLSNADVVAAAAVLARAARCLADRDSGFRGGMLRPLYQSGLKFNLQARLLA
jgi:hypothetical protein